MFVLIGTTIGSRAQTLNDPVYVNFTSLPATEQKNQPGELQANFWELNLSAPPVRLGKSINWVNSIYYRHTSLSVSDEGTQGQGYPAQLHDIRYSAVFRFQLNKGFELVAIPRVMIRSDFKQLFSEKDVFAQAVLLGTYAPGNNPNFRVGLGIALNNDFERNAIIPIGSLYYESKKFKAELVYPNANFLYKYSDKFEFGLFTSVDGAISRVQPIEPNGQQLSYFRSFQLLVAPTVSHQLFKNIYGHLKLGFAPLRYYEKLNPDFEAIAGERRELENSLFARVGLSYRLKN